MHRTRSPWRGALALTLTLVLPAAALAQNQVPECVQVDSAARYRVQGYDHWVTVENRCERAVTCEVATDVNPEAISIELAPGERREVLTWRGSPARTFTPHVRCTER